MQQLCSDNAVEPTAGQILADFNQLSIKISTVFITIIYHILRRVIYINVFVFKLDRMRSIIIYISINYVIILKINIADLLIEKLSGFCKKGF